MSAYLGLAVGRKIDGEGGVGINVEVLGGDIVRHEKAGSTVVASFSDKRPNAASSSSAWWRMVEVAALAVTALWNMEGIEDSPREKDAVCGLDELSRVLLLS